MTTPGLNPYKVKRELLVKYAEEILSWNISLTLLSLEGVLACKAQISLPPPYLLLSRRIAVFFKRASLNHTPTYTQMMFSDPSRYSLNMVLWRQNLEEYSIPSWSKSTVDPPKCDTYPSQTDPKFPFTSWPIAPARLTMNELVSGPVEAPSLNNGHTNSDMHRHWHQLQH